MTASMKVSVKKLTDLVRRLEGGPLQKELRGIAAEKGVQAIIGQAIHANFDAGGPGWEPLKFRKGQILKKTGLLIRSVTTPGAQGNVARVQGSTIKWGTSLPYAKIHNEGGKIVAEKGKAIKIPIPQGDKAGPAARAINKAAVEGKISIVKAKMRKSKNPYKYLKRLSFLKEKLAKGTGGPKFIYRKSVTIPKREFLVVRPVWVEQLNTYMKKRVKQILTKALRGGS